MNMDLAAQVDIKQATALTMWKEKGKTNIVHGLNYRLRAVYIKKGHGFRKLAA